ncbi:Leucine-rich repeat containing protein [Candidatus Rhodobacter oscarellae]|uniref:Leucine-rich repeat containing protein n=1 Tax=Candidatus Rhodobacter oscarellae TaxID=1675527 RepID=A0A0J9E8D1_9RHOB|nr:leucine-rich repeat domain-containing protein [Candidatus Rhodobacter lobularis]KMW58014.1 Leucine-rich repeat containing protein [Candidatus Rhodobacter lobularis]
MAMSYDQMNAEQRAAYDAARAEMAKVREEGGTGLALWRLTDNPFKTLTQLPPEIAELTNLQSLDLDYTQVTDLTPIAGLDKLQILQILSTQVTDLTPIAGLGQLQRLELNSTQVSDLTPIVGLDKLQSLDFRNTQVTDLTPIAGLGQLQTLDLSGTQVTDLTPIAGLGRLQSLDLNFTQVTDLTPLAGLDQLQTLDLNSTQVTDLTPIAALDGLQSLELDSTQVTDLTPIAGLDRLQSLRLGGTQVSDLTPIAGLGQLQTLFLSNTLVSDLTPIAGLGKLRALNLRGSAVADLRPLLQFAVILNPPEEPKEQLAVYIHETAAAAADPNLPAKRYDSFTEIREAMPALLEYLNSLPPYPEPLPWEVSGEDSKGPSQSSALELAWAQDGFGFNSGPVSLDQDPVALATLEDLREMMDELVRQSGNHHEDIYRRALALRDRLSGDAIDLVRAHLAFQRLQRIYDQRGNRSEPLDGDCAQTLQDLVETLPGLTLADEKVRDLLDRQAANRRDRVDAAEDAADIEVALAIAREDAPFDNEVQGVARDSAAPDVDDQLTRSRRPLAQNAVIAVVREFKKSPLGAAAAATTILPAAFSPEAAQWSAWLALNAETILTAARLWGQEYIGWVNPIVGHAKAAAEAIRAAKGKIGGS